MTSHDLNKLHHRVISSNLRLQQLKEMHAPNIIVRNEQRVLHEALGALNDDGTIQQTIADIGIESFINYFKHIGDAEIDLPAEAAVTLAQAA